MEGMGMAREDKKGRESIGRDSTRDDLRTMELSGADCIRGEKTSEERKGMVQLIKMIGSQRRIIELMAVDGNTAEGTEEAQN